ncbi:TolC family outer membrane protein [Xenophilus sp. Marseille-Q4582]|uniref:TolC family outer membrane protein n=1 Tax=Xenophilus sp. Marseille-Q4582 TaxID=2866600 RepID=UPI001CE47F7E|nr:TolC family outer membrane protein [Xenophilus sp. Marseille-Q4582]
MHPRRKVLARCVTLLRPLAAALLATGALAAHAFNLDDALVAARQHDAQFRAAVAEFEGSKEYRIQGRAGLLPEVSLSGSASRNHLDREQPYTDSRGVEQIAKTSQTYDANSLNLQVRQALYNREAIANMRRGDAQTRLGAWVMDANSDALTLRLVEAYSRVLLGQEQLRLAEAQVSAMTEGARAAERLFSRGEGTRTDVLESTSGLELALAQRIEAQAALDDALAALRAVVGPQVDLSSFRGLSVERFEFEPLQPARLEDWRALAREANADIMGRRIAVEVAEQDLARADAGHHPRVDLYAVLSRSRSDSVNTLNQLNEQAGIGIQVQVPLYQGGRINSLQRQALAGLTQAQALLDNTEQEVNLKLQTQYMALFSGARRIVALQAALESATEQIEATRKSVAGGVRIRLDVLRAQQQQTQVARELAQARFNHVMAWLTLRSLGGQLKQADLGEVQRKLEQGMLATPARISATAGG